MATLLMRLAGPQQSYGGYRYSVRTVGTSPVPTRSAVAGMIGACLGVTDYLPLLDRFTMRTRIDRTNPPESDLQVTVGPKAHEEVAWKRIRNLNDPLGKIPRNISVTGLSGKNDTSLAHRGFISHAEFIVELTVSDDDAAAWKEALRHPVHTPCLGRNGFAPAFPFYLGEWTGEGDALEALPHVPRTDRRAEPGPVPIVEVAGDRAKSEPRPTGTVAPARANRTEQLAWMKENLHR